MTTFSIQWWVKPGEGFNNTHALFWCSAVTSTITNTACGGKAFFHLTLLGHKPSLRKLGQELRSLEQKQRNRYRLLTCSLVHSCSASFLAQSRMTCPGMGLSTISWTLAHQPLVNVILTDNATVLSDETVLHLRFPGDFRLFPVDNKNYPAHHTFWRGVSSSYCHHQAVATVKRGQRTFPREANGSASWPGIERAKAKIPFKSRSVNQWVSLGHLQEHGWRKGCRITEKFQPPSNMSLG